MDIKTKLKHIFPNIYFSWFVKKEDRHFSKIIDIRKYIEDRYQVRFNYQIDLDNPQTFYEKLCFLKLFCKEKNPEELIDKVLVKDYLESLGFKHLIAKTIASYKTYNNFKKNIGDIKRRNKQFVVKLNHTSGEVFFYLNNSWKDKVGNKVPQRFVFACLKHKLKLNYYHASFEAIYQNITPQILIEEYLPSLDNGGLDEYKFFLNYGEVKMINVVYGRQKGSLLKEAFTDENLIVFPIRQNQVILNQDEIYKPGCFNQMVEFCKKTVSDRPIIRVDLMTDGKEFKFCEFTFYDCGGMNIFYPPEANKMIGDLFDISFVNNKV